MIVTTLKNRVLYITLNRPEKRNALNPALIEGLKEAFLKAKNDENVKIIVLKGNGEAFCAGADLAYLQSLQKNTYQENLDDSRNLMELFQLIYHLPKPVIAQVQGAALAGGCGLVTVCDIVFSTPTANFGFTEVRIGFIPAIVMVFLLRKIGESWAKRILISGEVLNAETAKQINLIHEIVPENEIEEFVTNFAENLTVQNSASSMGLTKLLAGYVQNVTLDDALTFAAEENARVRSTDDCIKGIASFLNKEKIKW